ncbi:MAG: class I SAM-dependent methyltransferase [Aggregatilineales bacterium]
MTKPPPRPRICDYEGSNYRTEFWENKDRDYEDRVERTALRRLLPPSGQRLLEIGAGFGRLTEEYSGFRQVVLLDYSLSLLQSAQERLGRSGRYIYVAADVYAMPFRPGVFDAATMVRVIHHMADASAALAQIARALAPGAVFILEYANKRNAKAIMRYALQRQTWNPFDEAPVEFVELNFDFHPSYIARALSAAGFTAERRLPVSFFRLSALKNALPTDTLVRLDSLLQRTGLLYTPSVFVRARASRPNAPDNLAAEAIFACPETGAPLVVEGDTLVSRASGRRWAVRDGIYDFKAPLE